MEINMGWISTSGERLPDIELIADIKESLGKIDGVTDVEVLDGGNEVFVTYSGSRASRKKIYDAEVRLMDKYPDGLFDFHVLSPPEDSREHNKGE